jgi:hypothetical protein
MGRFKKILCFLLLKSLNAFNSAYSGYWNKGYLTYQALVRAGPENIWHRIANARFFGNL